tara:strand:+ start:1242 stop:1913 length:672 start_codon:yes stop_codon:yes gene_type:complete
MEALTTLMQTLDLNSKIISEGDYLKMCDSIKTIHDYIKSETDSESDGEEDFRIRRVDIPIPFSPIPNLPPLGDNLEDLTIYDTVTPPQSRRGDYVHPDLPEILTPPPESLRDHELEDELMEVNRLMRETLKNMEKLKYRRNITNFVRQEAVKRRAQELGIRLHRYTIGSLLDAGHDVGDARIFFKEYLEDYNDDIDRKYNELEEVMKELEQDKTAIIDELINF